MVDDLQYYGLESGHLKGLRQHSLDAIAQVDITNLFFIHSGDRVDLGLEILILVVLDKGRIENLFGILHVVLAFHFV